MHLLNSQSRPLVAFLTLALCTMTQCVCQNRTSDSPNPGEDKVKVDPAKGKTTTPAKTVVAIPKTVDSKDLDADEKKILGGVLSEQFDPCGSPKSLLDVLNTNKPCDRAVVMSGKLVTWIGQGLSKRQVVKKYLSELARTTSKATFQYEGSPAYGDPGAKIKIVKFTDFQCPFCKLASQPLKEYAKKYNAVLYIKHMPLKHHEFAREGALMAMAAQKQGKFWEVYKAFFDKQNVLSSELMRQLVVKAGLDMARFDKDLKSPELPALLERDRKEADDAKVDGTPTIFVDGYRVEYDNLEDKLKELQ